MLMVYTILERDNDKIKINKKKYWEFVNNGGNKRKWEKEWVIEDGSSKFLYDVGWDNMDEKTTNKLLLDNSNIIVDLQAN